MSARQPGRTCVRLGDGGATGLGLGGETAGSLPLPLVSGGVVAAAGGELLWVSGGVVAAAQVAASA